MALSACSLANFGVIVLVLLRGSDFCEAMKVDDSQVEAVNEKRIQSFANMRAPTTVSKPVSKPASAFWNNFLGDEFVEIDKDSREVVDEELNEEWSGR
mmetsp:Transcript_23761/g.56204  ORF Transcript_23761/g.56204 Transcript_23761/m.56204 type:complete len:98 (-) Transcript_23761:11-304(-)